MPEPRKWRRHAHRYAPRGQKQNLDRSRLMRQSRQRQGGPQQESQIPRQRGGPSPPQPPQPGQDEGGGGGFWGGLAGVGKTIGRGALKGLEYYDTGLDYGVRAPLARTISRVGQGLGLRDPLINPETGERFGQWAPWTDARNYTDAFRETLPAGAAFGFDTATDPALLSGVGWVGKGLRAGGAALQAGGRAGAGRAAARVGQSRWNPAGPLLEGIGGPRATAGFLLGGSLATQAAAEYDVPGIPEWGEQLAAGLGGGVLGASAAARSRGFGSSIENVGGADELQLRGQDGPAPAPEGFERLSSGELVKGELRIRHDPDAPEAEQWSAYVQGSRVAAAADEAAAIRLGQEAQDAMGGGFFADEDLGRPPAPDAEAPPSQDASGLFSQTAAPGFETGGQQGLTPSPRSAAALPEEPPAAPGSDRPPSPEEVKPEPGGLVTLAGGRDAPPQFQRDFPAEHTRLNPAQIGTAEQVFQFRGGLNQQVVRNLSEDMIQNGYAAGNEIEIIRTSDHPEFWGQGAPEYIVWTGHHRLAAAKAAGLDDIPVYVTQADLPRDLPRIQEASQAANIQAHYQTEGEQVRAARFLREQHATRGDFLEHATTQQGWTEPVAARMWNLSHLPADWDDLLAQSNTAAYFERLGGFRGHSDFALSSKNISDPNFRNVVEHVERAMSSFKEKLLDDPSFFGTLRQFDQALGRVRRKAKAAAQGTFDFDIAEYRVKGQDDITATIADLRRLRTAHEKLYAGAEAARHNVAVNARISELEALRQEAREAGVAPDWSKDDYLAIDIPLEISDPDAALAADAARALEDVQGLSEELEAMREMIRTERRSVRELTGTLEQTREGARRDVTAAGRQATAKEKMRQRKDEIRMERDLRREARAPRNPGMGPPTDPPPPVIRPDSEPLPRPRGEDGPDSFDLLNRADTPGPKKATGGVGPQGVLVRAGEDTLRSVMRGTKRALGRMVRGTTAEIEKGRDAVDDAIKDHRRAMTRAGHSLAHFSDTERAYDVAADITVDADGYVLVDGERLEVERPRSASLKERLGIEVEPGEPEMVPVRLEDLTEGPGSETTRGNLGRAEITDEQLEALAMRSRMNAGVKETLRRGGLVEAEDPNITAEYHGRKVRLYRNWVEAGRPKEVLTGQNRRKVREFMSAAQAEEFGFDLENPYTGRFMRQYERVLEASEAKLANDLRKIGADLADYEGDERMLVYIGSPAPGLNDLTLPAPLARHVQKVLAPRGDDHKAVAALQFANNLARTILSPFEASFLLLQGLPSVLWPQRWAGTGRAVVAAAAQSYGALRGDEKAWARHRIARDEQLRERGWSMAKLGAHELALYVEGSEFTIPAEFAGGFARRAGDITSRVPIVGAVATKGIARGFNSANMAFTGFLQEVQIEESIRLLDNLQKIGLEGDDLSEAMMKVNAGVSRLYGRGSSDVSEWERGFIYAPRFLRASLEINLKLIEGILKAGNAPIDAAIARNEFAKWLINTMAIVTTINAANGHDTAYDPRDSNFLTLRDIGGSDFRVMGNFAVPGRLMAEIILGSPYRDGNWVENAAGAIGRTAWSKSSPALSPLITGLITRETYLGKEVDAGQTEFWKEQGLNLVPFGIQSLIREGSVSAAGSALGAQGSPLTEAEARNVALDRATREQYPDRFEEPSFTDRLTSGARGLVSDEETPFEQLSGGERAEIRRLPHVAPLVDAAQERAVERGGAGAAIVEITRKRRGGQLAIDGWLERGGDDQGNPYTGDDWRRDHHNLRRAQAAAMDHLDLSSRDAELGGWWELYDQVTDPAGRLDYDTLEELQVEYEREHPDIRAKVAHQTGQYDTEIEQLYREQAAPAASEYYGLGHYRGMSPELGRKAVQADSLARQLVSFGMARDRREAIRLVGQILGAEYARALRRSRGRARNPARSRFRRNNPIFARFYSDIPTGLLAA